MYALALGVDASEDGLLVSYGMPDLPESTGQGKEEEKWKHQGVGDQRREFYTDRGSL